MLITLSHFFTRVYEQTAHKRKSLNTGLSCVYFDFASLVLWPPSQLRPSDDPLSNSTKNPLLKGTVSAPDPPLRFQKSLCCPNAAWSISDSVMTSKSLGPFFFFFLSSIAMGFSFSFFGFLSNTKLHNSQCFSWWQLQRGDIRFKNPGLNIAGTNVLRSDSPNRQMFRIIFTSWFLRFSEDTTFPFSWLFLSHLPGKEPKHVKAQTSHVALFCRSQASLEPSPSLNQEDSWCWYPKQDIFRLARDFQWILQSKPPDGPTLRSCFNCSVFAFASMLWS